MMVITTMLTIVMIITTSTTTAMVMALMLLLLWLVVLRCYTESVPMVEQVRADFYVRFHLLIILIGQITATTDRGLPTTTNTTDAPDAIGYRPICTSTSAAATATIQSIRLASLFVDFHIS